MAVFFYTIKVFIKESSTDSYFFVGVPESKIVCVQGFFIFEMFGEVINKDQE